MTEAAGRGLPRTLGPTVGRDGRCGFRVWAPFAERVELRLKDPDQTVDMRPFPRGSFATIVRDVEPGRRYAFSLDGGDERPDPASRSQPDGVHGPSEVVATDGFAWSDEGWNGPELRDYVVYELHVGTFTADGTFDAAIDHLDELRELGVAAVEAMPVAQFPGRRNWGYDGVLPFAVQSSYGGADGLKRLVDACHARGMAFVLDVVYNHLGPEGNYLREFGPYFTDRYRTPWGDAVNFDGPGSDEVRRYFLENALRWFEEFHVDALRLDAIHGIVDVRPVRFLEELSEAVASMRERLGRRLYLIAESDLGDPHVVRPRDEGGLGMDAQWTDDFHHSVHALLTGERTGYYRDFGSIEHLARAMRQGYTYTGQYSQFRERSHGAPTDGVPPERFVVCIQNHDQVGNRLFGERLSKLASFEQLKLAAGIMLLSPFVPLLFMGEEYGEEAPFQYFVEHSDEGLIASVRAGRREEFAGFGWDEEPPDPQDEATFVRSKLDRSLLAQKPNRALRDLYRELLRLRREVPALGVARDRDDVAVDHDGVGVMTLQRTSADGDDAVIALFNFSDASASVALDAVDASWEKLIDSAEEVWDGPGSEAPPSITPSAGAVRLSPHSFAAYRRRGAAS